MSTEGTAGLDEERKRRYADADAAVHRAIFGSASESEPDESEPDKPGESDDLYADVDAAVHRAIFGSALESEPDESESDESEPDESDEPDDLEELQRRYADVDAAVQRAIAGTMTPDDDVTVGDALRDTRANMVKGLLSTAFTGDAPIRIVRSMMASEENRAAMAELMEGLTGEPPKTLRGAAEEQVALYKGDPDYEMIYLLSTITVAYRHAPTARDRAVFDAMAAQVPADAAAKYGRCVGSAPPITARAYFEAFGLCGHCAPWLLDMWRAAQAQVEARFGPDPDAGSDDELDGHVEEVPAAPPSAET